MTHPETRPAAEQRFTQRLAPAGSFEDATASIQAALAQLERAENALERQLRDLRIYIGKDSVRATS